MIVLYILSFMIGILIGYKIGAWTPIVNIQEEIIIEEEKNGVI